MARIFPYSDWIQRYTEHLSVFSPNAGEKTPYLDTFHAVVNIYILHRFLSNVFYIILFTSMTLYFEIFMNLLSFIVRSFKSMVISRRFRKIYQHKIFCDFNWWSMYLLHIKRFNLLTTNVPIIKKPFSWFASKSTDWFLYDGSNSLWKVKAAVIS